MGKKLKVAAAVGGSLVVVVLVGNLVNNAQRPAITPNTGGATTIVGSTPPPPPVEPGDFSLIRPFDTNISFNRPVSEFGRSDKYEKYVERLWKYGSFGGWDDPTKRGQFDLELRDYSVPIYDAREATGTRRAFFANFGYPPEPGASVDFPWNDAWEAAPGNDAQLLAANPDTGELWIMWSYQKNNPSTCLSLANLARGFNPVSDLCAGGVSRLENEDGSVGDYRTWNSYDPSRGMGIPKLALVATSYEVREGVIEHALQMTVFNTMFGPECSNSEIGTNAAGSTCGFYLPPATQVEWHNNAPTSCGENSQKTGKEYREKTVPEGLRFALDISDEEIEQWLDGRSFTGPLRSTARIFAVALRDYGFIIAETGCYGTVIQTDGMVNPASRAIWESLGIADTPEAENLLDGLASQERIYAVNPPEPVEFDRPPRAGMGS